MLKKSLIVLGIILVGIQFFRPVKNTAGDAKYAIFIKYRITKDVSTVIKSACLDCHSILTRYPWYYNVQPAGWFMANHIDKGKKHLNFTNFSSGSIAEQYHKFEKIVEVVENKTMPLSSYTWFGQHPDAKLSDAQRKTLIDWAKLQQSYLEETFPADSLVIKK